VIESSVAAHDHLSDSLKKLLRVERAISPAKHPEIVLASSGVRKRRSKPGLGRPPVGPTSAQRCDPGGIAVGLAKSDCTSVKCTRLMVAFVVAALVCVTTAASSRHMEARWDPFKTNACLMARPEAVMVRTNRIPPGYRGYTLGVGAPRYRAGNWLISLAVDHYPQSLLGNRGVLLTFYSSPAKAKRQFERGTAVLRKRGPHFATRALVQIRGNLLIEWDRKPDGPALRLVDSCLRLA
jgi:hypothetical protein